MFAPNTFLIGAQKSGTTYLASLLDRHPRVCVSTPKETHYFSSHFEMGNAAYRATFSDPDAEVTLDASTSYSFLRPLGARDRPDAPGYLAPVPERIREIRSDVRFIYIMRDPVERMMSAYRHGLATGQAAEVEVSLLDALERDPMLGLISRYADQIELYLSVFGIEHFLFLRFEDLASDPQATLRTCAAFLDIDAAPLLANLDRAARNEAHAATALGRQLNRHHRIKAAGARVLPAAMRRALARRLLRRTPDPVRFIHTTEAARLFDDDLARVARLTGLRI